MSSFKLQESYGWLMVKPLNNFFLVFGCQVLSGLHANPLTRPLTQSFHSTCTCMFRPTLVSKSSKSLENGELFLLASCPLPVSSDWNSSPKGHPTAPELGPWPLPLGVLRSTFSENRLLILFLQQGCPSHFMVCLQPFPAHSQLSWPGLSSD